MITQTAFLYHKYRRFTLIIHFLQADVAANNSVVIGKLSNITGTRRKQVPTDDDIASDSDDSSDEDEEDGALSSIKTPILQVK